MRGAGSIRRFPQGGEEAEPRVYVHEVSFATISYLCAILTQKSGTRLTYAETHLTFRWILVQLGEDSVSSMHCVVVGIKWGLADTTTDITSQPIHTLRWRPINRFS